MISTILLILAAVGLVRFFWWLDTRPQYVEPSPEHLHNTDGPIKVRYECDPPVTVSTCSVCGAFDYAAWQESEWNFNAECPAEQSSLLARQQLPPEYLDYSWPAQIFVKDHFAEKPSEPPTASKD